MNVRSLYEGEKIHNLVRQMRRMNIDILGVSEHRWHGSGKYISDNGDIMYCSGNFENDHRNGVAVSVNESMSRSTTNFIPLSLRVMMM